MVNGLVLCLRAAHGAGVVHRDVRPENVMMGKEGVILNDWGCSAMTSKGAAQFSGTFRYARDEVLDAAIDMKRRIPLPQDDLHSLVRSVLALNDPEIRKELSSIEIGDYSAAIQFWKSWRAKNNLYDHFFQAAETCDYDGLCQLR